MLIVFAGAKLEGELAEWRHAPAFPYWVGGGGEATSEYQKNGFAAGVIGNSAAVCHWIFDSAVLGSFDGGVTLCRSSDSGNQCGHHSAGVRTVQKLKQRMPTLARAIEADFHLAMVMLPGMIVVAAGRRGSHYRGVSGGNGALRDRKPSGS